MRCAVVKLRRAEWSCLELRWFELQPLFSGVASEAFPKESDAGSRSALDADLAVCI